MARPLPPPYQCRRAFARQAGFTLLELLAVLGIVGLFAGVAALGWRGAGAGVARDSAVATLAGLIEQARSHAARSGANAAVFIHADPATPARYLRYAVVGEPADGGWRPLDGGALLTGGVVVVPNANPLSVAGPGACKRVGVDWTRPSGGDIRSTALRPATRLALIGTVAEWWIRIEFTPHGTTLSSGDLIVATGRPAGPEAPERVLLDNPDDVAGLALSQYGHITFLRHRRDL